MQKIGVCEEARGAQGNGQRLMRDTRREEVCFWISARVPGYMGTVVHMGAQRESDEKAGVKTAGKHEVDSSWLEKYTRRCTRRLDASSGTLLTSPSCCQPSFSLPSSLFCFIRHLRKHSNDLQHRTSSQRGILGGVTRESNIAPKLKTGSSTILPTRLERLAMLFVWRGKRFEVVERKVGCPEIVVL